jgi:hypothetical protein
MKSINQFDYPSKEAQSYKIHSQTDSHCSKDHSQSNLTRYK